MDTPEGSVGRPFRTKLKIGVIGLGSIGQRHLNNIIKLGCSTAVYDTAHTPIESWNDILECDAVVIASPTTSHYNYIMELHGAHIPMFVEKPLIATRKEWETVPLKYIKMVGYNLRFHSCTYTVRDWMAVGAIGKPLWAQFTCAQKTKKEIYLRDGVILNWSHEIDLAIHLLGKADVITATATQKAHYQEDMADIILGHHNGCQTTVHLDYLTIPERRAFIIVGEDGSIEADLLSRRAYCRDNKGQMIYHHIGADTFDNNYLSEMQTFIVVLQGCQSTAFPYCTAKEAHAVADICLEAREYIRVI